jgi:hypothetical protein
MQRVYAIHPAKFNEPYALATQFTPELLDLFDRHAELIVPTHVIHHEWPRRMDCLRAALTYAIDHPSVTPYYGLALYIGGRDATEARWCLHAWCVEPEGIVIDSSMSPYLVAAYGLKFGNEVYRALPKRPGAKTAAAATELPDVLRREYYTASTDGRSRATIAERESVDGQIESPSNPAILR